MSIASEITRLQNSKADVKTIVNKDKDLINGGTAFIDDETVDDYDDKIAEMQEAYKKFIPIQSESGTTEVTIDNTGDTKALTSVQIDGNIEQFTTTGKNLFDYTKISSVTNGTNNNGIITSTTNITSGNKNVVIGFSTAPISVSANTTIYFSADIKLNSNSTGSFGNINDNVNGGTTKILNPTLSTTYQRYQTSYKYTSATTNTALLIQTTNLIGSVEISNIMISTSNEASFEPFTGRNSLT